MGRASGSEEEGGEDSYDSSFVESDEEEGEPGEEEGLEESTGD